MVFCQENAGGIRACLSERHHTLFLNFSSVESILHRFIDLHVILEPNYFPVSEHLRRKQIILACGCAIVEGFLWTP